MRIRQLFSSEDKSQTPDPVRDEKLFCISFQRTGTTSVGQFLKGLGYPVADWAVSSRNAWGRKWVEGQFDQITESEDFRTHQAFEDGPWFAPEFYRFLYHRFPKSRFILFERDAEAWFASMLSHSKGRSLGVTAVHAKIYRREAEYLDLCDNAEDPGAVDINGLELAGHKDHYIDIYRVRNRETRQFFQERNASRLCYCRLEDPEKWKKLATYLGHDPDAALEVHANKSPQPGVTP